MALIVGGKRYVSPGTRRVVERSKNTPKKDRTGTTNETLAERIVREKSEVEAANKAAVEQSAREVKDLEAQGYTAVATSKEGGVIYSKTTSVPESPKNLPQDQSSGYISPAVRRGMEEARKEDERTIVIDTSPKSPLQGNNRLGQTLRTGAAKASIFLTRAGEEASSIAEQQRTNPRAAPRLLKVLSYPTAGLGYVSKASAVPLRQFAETDQELGKELVIGYGGGKLIGAASAALPNYAATKVLTRFSGTPEKAGRLAARAYTSTTAAITGTGVAATGLSFYGATPEQAGKAIPSLVVGGITGSRSYKQFEPGIRVVSTARVPSVSGGRSTFRSDGNTFGEITTTRNLATVNVYGKTQQIPFNVVNTVAGAKVSKGVFDVDVSTYGGFTAGGKRFSINELYSGRIQGRSFSLKDTSGGVFEGRVTKPVLIASDGAGSSLYGSKTFFKTSTREGNVLSAGVSEKAYEPISYISRRGGVVKNYGLDLSEGSNVLKVYQSKLRTVSSKATVSEGRVLSASSRDIVQDVKPRASSFKISGKRGSAQFLQSEQIKPVRIIRSGVPPEAFDFSVVPLKGFSAPSIVPGFVSGFTTSFSSQIKPSFIASPSSSTQQFFTPTPPKDKIVQDLVPVTSIIPVQKQRSFSFTTTSSVPGFKNPPNTTVLSIVPPSPVPKPPFVPIGGFDSGGGLGSSFGRGGRSRKGKNKFDPSVYGASFGIKQKGSKMSTGVNPLAFRGV